MCSAAMVNQFEMKDTCFEFMINVSWQGEDKIEFKNKFSEIAVLISFFVK